MSTACRLIESQLPSSKRASCPCLPQVTLMLSPQILSPGPLCLLQSWDFSEIKQRVKGASCGTRGLHLDTDFLAGDGKVRHRAQVTLSWAHTDLEAMCPARSLRLMILLCGPSPLRVRVCGTLLQWPSRPGNKSEAVIPRPGVPSWRRNLSPLLGFF